jgi:hypothetical protein
MAKTGDKMFDQFWLNYGKIKGKHKTHQLWNKLSQSEKELAVTGAVSYAKRVPDAKFRKDPERWINHKCFKDEIDWQEVKTETTVPAHKPFKEPEYERVDFDEWADEIEAKYGRRPERIDPTDTTKMWFKRKFGE